MNEGPDFSGVAASYSEVRPGYPDQLFDWLASLVDRREAAWDTATGNGQAAVGLARHFRRVIATDRSAEQIRRGKRHPRVEYHVARAEVSGLPARSIDLIVAAAALHWFDLPRFFEEVERVGRSGSVLAAWTYHVAHVAPPFDDLLWPFYRDVVASHFAPGARLVDERYEGIALPGEHIDAPAFEMCMDWTAQQMLDFVRTWSGVQAHLDTTGRDPVEDLAYGVRELWGSAGETRRVRWPVYLLAARL